MRKVTYGGGVSLDHYLARPDHAVDWLRWGPEAAAVTADYWKTIDTVLMGRKTYDVARGGGTTGGYKGVSNYVFSRTLQPGADATVTVVSGDAAAFVRSLNRTRGKDICLMGGGELARSLFEAGLIDEVGLNVHPVLLGGGVPLVPGIGRRVNLELVSAKPLEGGCVYALYRVKR